jgi:DNA-binding NarL/FixJ family response regulator
MVKDYAANQDQHHMPAHSAITLPEAPGFASLRHTAGLPLSGLTLLAVEDSRFASEALRLLCQRSGARLRRAETLAAARRHLFVYRPDVVLVDLGLPDGNGLDLIRELSKSRAGACLVLATSGDPALWSSALRAGAAGFLEKPVESVEGFQQSILRHLAGQVPLAGPEQHIRPDPQALYDDLLNAAHLVEGKSAAPRRYVADFVRGLARSTQDLALERAAVAAQGSDDAMSHLAALIRKRIAEIVDPFAVEQAGRG